MAETSVLSTSSTATTTSARTPSASKKTKNNNNNNSIIKTGANSQSSPTQLSPTQVLSNLFREEDFGLLDEIKVFGEPEEGEGDDTEELLLTSEEVEAELTEEKTSLIRETEEAMGRVKAEALGVEAVSRPVSSPGSPYSNSNGFNSGAPINSLPAFPHSPTSYPPPPYGNNDTIPPPSSHMARSTGSPLSPPFFYNDSSAALGSPPPAHIGGIPYNLADHGLRSLYALPPPHSSYPYSLITGGSDSSHYGTSPFPRYGGLSPSDLDPTSMLSSSSGFVLGAENISTPGSGIMGHHQSNLGLALGKGGTGKSPREKKSSQQNQKDQAHIKKPLNAFMLYMKEMRPKIVAECTLKESAAINQILGRRWHSLTRDEQAKYYEMARKERQLHMQLYPGWSARDNYAQNKKKKRKRLQQQQQQHQQQESSKPQELSPNARKCHRIRYGVDQDFWCKTNSSPPPLTIHTSGMDKKPQLTQPPTPLQLHQLISDSSADCVSSAAAAAAVHSVLTSNPVCIQQHHPISSAAAYHHHNYINANTLDTLTLSNHQDQLEGAKLLHPQANENVQPQHPTSANESHSPKYISL